MARPKKDSSRPEARQRIIDAFWSLLEDHRLHDITVNMIVERADCNRGTFYYHYTDIDSLVYTAIENEFYKGEWLPEQLFKFATEPIDEAMLDKLVKSQRMSRLALAIRQGGLDLVEEKVKSITVDFWKAALCPNGEELDPQVRIAIEYNGSGLLSVIAFCTREENQDLIEENSYAAVDFFREFVNFMFDYIVSSQGVSRDEIAARLRTANEITKMRRG